MKHPISVSTKPAAGQLAPSPGALPASGVDDLIKAVAPFVAAKDAVRVQDSVKLISKDRFDDMTLISLTITKGQYLRALKAYAAVKPNSARR